MPVGSGSCLSWCFTSWPGGVLSPGCFKVGGIGGTEKGESHRGWLGCWWTR